MGTITRDISEIKRAREEIEAAHRRLQQANEELTRLYARAKELDELKTQLFANVSHELRTPLTLILGPIEKHLGSTTGLDADLRQDLEVVERNARTVLRHVERSARRRPTSGWPLEARILRGGCRGARPLRGRSFFRTGEREEHRSSWSRRRPRSRFRSTPTSCSGFF